MSIENAISESVNASEWRFAEVEIMGHRSHLGRARETEFLGGKYLKVEDLADGRSERVSMYPERAIFSIRWFDAEEGQRRVAEMQHENGTAPDEQKRVEVRSVIDRAAFRGPLTREEIRLCTVMALPWCSDEFFASVFDDMAGGWGLEAHPAEDGQPVKYSEGIPF